MKPSSSLRNARSAPLVLVSTARERAHETQWSIRWLVLLTSTLAGFSLRQTITSSTASSRQALCASVGMHEAALEAQHARARQRLLRTKPPWAQPVAPMSTTWAQADLREGFMGVVYLTFFLL